MSLTVRRFLLALPSLLAAVCAQANSTVGRGIIIKADAQGGNQGSYIVVRNEYSTPAIREDEPVTWKVGKDAVITLDGKRADFTAFVPGRLVFLCRDASLFKVYTGSSLLPPSAAVADPQNAWWTVRLPTQLAQGAIHGKPGRGSALVLHFETRSGAVRRAAALTPAWGPAYGSSPTWHEVDAAGVKVEGGRLVGACPVVLQDSGRKFAGGSLTERHEIQLDLASDGGSAKCDGQALPKGIAVECRAAPIVAGDWYCFLRAPDPDPGNETTHQDNLRLEIRRRNKGIEQSAFAHGYGKPGAGRPAKTLEAEIADGTMTIRAGDGTIAYEITGMVLGDRVFGTYSAKHGDKSFEGRFSAYLRQVDAPSIGWGEGDAKKEKAALQGGGK